MKRSTEAVATYECVYGDELKEAITVGYVTNKTSPKTEEEWTKYLSKEAISLFISKHRFETKNVSASLIHIDLEN